MTHPGEQYYPQGVHWDDPLSRGTLPDLLSTAAAEYGARGVRTNYIAPTVIRTGMTADFWEMDFFKRTNFELTPADRQCTTADVANTVAFLCSERARHIQGTAIAVDGGATAGHY